MRIFPIALIVIGSLGVAKHLGFIDARTVVFDLDDHSGVLVTERGAHAAGVGVLHDIGERFLGQAEHHGLLLSAQARDEKSKQRDDKIAEYLRNAAPVTASGAAGS